MLGHTVHGCKLKKKHLEKRRAMQAANSNASANVATSKYYESQYDSHNYANASVHRAAIVFVSQSFVNSNAAALNAEGARDSTVKGEGGMVWVEDSGCTHYMTYNKSNFVNL